LFKTVTRPCSKKQRDMTKLFSKTTVYLILIVLLAGAVRTARALEEERFSTDVYLYFQMAESWAYHGADYMVLYDNDHIPPLLPWVMAMGYNWGLTPEYTGLIIGGVLGALMPLAAFWIALNLFSTAKRQNEDVQSGVVSAEKVLPRNHAYALLAAFLVAVHPFLVRISVSCLREILYLPLMAFAVAFAISAISNKSLWKWCVFAVLVALANITRREGIFIIVIFFAWQIVELVVDRKNFRKNIICYVLISFLVSIIFLGLTFPVLYFISRDTPSTWSPFGIFEIR
jgi:hypothetical protein